MLTPKGRNAGAAGRPSSAGQRGGAIVLTCAALFALAGLAALVWQSSAGASGDAAAGQRRGLTAPAITGQRLICSFSNDDAKAALVQGADGGASIVTGGRAYWLFGDTLFLPQSGKQIEQNSIAWSTGMRAGGCPALQYYGQNGVAMPFVPKDGSLTVWPVGGWSSDDHSIDLFTAYVYGTGPYNYWIGAIGVAHLDTRTMQTTVVEHSVWNAQSGFSSAILGATAVERDSDGLLRVVLETKDDGELLARVAPQSMAVAGAYEYWDGTGWSREPAQARPLWPQAHASGPVQRLATFDNGVDIAYNAFLRKYIAVQNIGFDKIGARVADRLEGPWSAPVVWIDCSAIAGPAVPVCYSPYQHPELGSPDGRTLFLTFTRKASYDVVAYEVTLDAATTPGQSSQSPGTHDAPGSADRARQQ